MFETLTVRQEGAVLFVDIAAPPMNLLGPGLVRDLVSLIQRAEADDASQVLVFKSADPALGVLPGGGGAQHLARLMGAARALEVMLSADDYDAELAGLAPAEEFRRDSDLFGEGVRRPEAQSRIRAAMKRGFQTRDAEMALARLLGDLADG